MKLEKKKKAAEPPGPTALPGGAGDFPETSLSGRMIDYNNVFGPTGLPIRPRQAPCVMYMTWSLCTASTHCQFDHPTERLTSPQDWYGFEGLPIRPSKGDCTYYLVNGRCGFGKKCYNHHPNWTSLGVEGLPVRISKRNCAFYMKNGYCGFGNECRNHHPPLPQGEVKASEGSANEDSNIKSKGSSIETNAGSNALQTNKKKLDDTTGNTASQGPQKKQKQNESQVNKANNTSNDTPDRNRTEFNKDDMTENTESQEPQKKTKKKRRKKVISTTKNESQANTANNASNDAPDSKKTELNKGVAKGKDASYTVGEHVEVLHRGKWVPGKVEEFLLEDPPQYKIQISNGPALFAQKNRVRYRTPFAITFFNTRCSNLEKMLQRHGGRLNLNLVAGSYKELFGHSLKHGFFNQLEAYLRSHFSHMLQVESRGPKDKKTKTVVLKPTKTKPLFKDSGFISSNSELTNEAKIALTLIFSEHAIMDMSILDSYMKEITSGSYKEQVNRANNTPKPREIMKRFGMNFGYNQGSMCLKGFLSWYRQSALSKPFEVWRDLGRFNFRNDLRRPSMDVDPTCEPLRCSDCSKAQEKASKNTEGQEKVRKEKVNSTCYNNKAVEGLFKLLFEEVEKHQEQHSTDITPTINALEELKKHEGELQETVQSLQQRLDQKQERVLHMTKQCKELQDQHKKIDKCWKSLSKEHEKCALAKESMEKKAREESDSYQKLIDELKIESTIHSSLHVSLANLRKKHQTLQAELKTFRDDRAKCEEKMTKKNKELADEKQRLENSNQKLEKTVSELQAVNCELSDSIKVRISTLEDSVVQSIQMKDKEKKSSVVVKKKTCQSAAVLDPSETSTASSVVKLQRDLEGAHQLLYKRDKDIMAQRTEIEENQELITELQDQIKKMNIAHHVQLKYTEDLIKKQEERLSSETNQAEERREEISHLKSQIERLQKDVNLLHKAQDEKKSHFAKVLTDTTKEYESKLQECEQKKQEATEFAQTLEMQLEDFKNQKASINEDLEYWKSEAISVNELYEATKKLTNATELGIKNSKLEDELNSLKIELKNSRDFALEKESRLNDECASLKEQCSILKAQVQFLKDKMKKAEQEIRSLKMEGTKQKGKNESLLKEVAQQDGKVQFLLKDLVALRKFEEEAKKQNEQLQTKLKHIELHLVEANVQNVLLEQKNEKMDIHVADAMLKHKEMERTQEQMRTTIKELNDKLLTDKKAKINHPEQCKASGPENLKFHEVSLETKQEIQSFEKIWALKNSFCYNMVDTWNAMEAYRRIFNRMKRQNLVSNLRIDEENLRVLTVNRADVVGDVFKSDLFKARKLHGQQSVFTNLEVRFVSGDGNRREMEDGIDMSGLTNELNSLFWDQLETYCLTDSEFEGKDEKDHVQLFHKEDENSIVFLPVAHCDKKTGEAYVLTKQLEQCYKIVGRFLLRAFLSNLTVPSAFASNILVDYLLNFDLRYSRKSLQEMLSDLLAIDPSYSWVQKVFEDKNAKCHDLLCNEDSSQLIGENARDCLKQFIKQRIIEPREQQLKAIALGFFLDNTFSVGPFLEICSSPKELRLLISGEEVFDVDRLWEIIEFESFGKEEKKIKGYFRRVLEDMSEKELRLFLRFVTGLYALPMNNRAEALRIIVKPDQQSTSGVRFPQAATCDRQLILPKYRSKSEMQERLFEAIQPRHSRFMLK